MTLLGTSITPLEKVSSSLLIFNVHNLCVQLAMQPLYL